MKRMVHKSATALPFLITLIGTPVLARETPPGLNITLTPGAPDTAHHIPYVDVTIIAEGMDRAAGEKLFRLPVFANTVPTSASVITTPAIADARGPLSTSVRDVAEDGSNTTRFWATTRPIHGAVTISYRVPINAEMPLLGLPQYEMRTEGATFSASANAFLILPDDDMKRKLSIRWDFTAYGAGGIGTSSFGVGDVTTQAPVSTQEAASSYYMAGKPGLFRAPDGGFFGAWQGQPTFPMTDVMQWASKLHRFYGQFFGYTAENFGVFGRSNPLNPGSGIGLTDSFAFTFGPPSTPIELRGLLAHEMVHSWIGSLDNSMDQAGGLDRAWFGEGLAVYYQRDLPHRAGMMSDQDFLDDLNSTAARYYTDIMINVPNADIPEGFWRDTRIRVLPYDRGSLYFATVNAQIRKQSGGKRSIDDIVRAMLNARRAGQDMNETLWRTLLKAELGDQGVTDFEAMLNGQRIDVPTDAFGPRFRRTTHMLRRYDLGFDMASLRTKPRMVQGLKHGSNAEKAGVRNGDIILNSFPQDALQGDQTAYLTLKVQRGDQELSFRYQPRGEQVPAYQWELVDNAAQPAVAR